MPVYKVFDLRKAVEDKAERVARKRLNETMWISCSKKLPKKDGDYLVTTNNGQTAIYFFIKGISEKYWMQYATAWMPLPKPYRGEGGNA